jgi:hypothetical protein
VRGIPYLKLRRALARALRQALAGSLAIAVLAIVVATWSSIALERDGTPEDVAPPSDVAVSSTTADSSAEASVAIVDVRPALVEVVEPVREDSEQPATEITERPERQTEVAAIQQLAGPEVVLSTEEQWDALLVQVAERDDVPDVVEPPYVLTEGQTGSPPLAPGSIVSATISFYYCEQGGSASSGDGGGFCGAMRDGTVVYEGAAACAYTYLGQRFRIVGDPTERIYTCHDTGNEVHGLHRDIFFYTSADGWPWLYSVGTRVVLEIIV